MTDRESLIAPAPPTGPITVDGRDPIPVTLLTGFLGAGKTTLLNRILSAEHGLRVGVLVNDFGAINIDAALVDSVHENTISLTNGCVCCEIRDDLVTSLEQLLTERPDLDHIILEASGVADPAGIVMTFLDARYEQLLRMDSITCVVDTEGILTQDDEQLLGLILRQVAFADLVVLNKTDLVTPDHVQVARDWINLHIKRIRMIEATHGQVPLEALIAVDRFDPQRTPMQSLEVANIRHPDLDRWSYQSDEPFSREKLQRMVQRELPASVLRCKGVVFTTDSPDRPLSLQVVGRRTQLDQITASASRGTVSQVVAIGQEIDPDELTRLFDACRES